ncbi:hypothetical protein SpAn4DRAFT_0181 [Sporomusa ovata]|uniref:Uncharacterized protein n=1 Tax=Sporomusa ovata TaxID=2378 RepID=A0A0U1L304_9FIRM|nr:hypothetical protein SpAn4DRAFT_0181 [Sporomusa ovata]
MHDLNSANTPGHRFYRSSADAPIYGEKMPCHPLSMMRLGECRPPA